MNHEEMIAVIQAHKDGREIEYQNYNAGPWYPTASPAWNFTACKYRVKPEEPKLVPHWPAIRRSSNGEYSISDYLYADVETAQRNTSYKVVRLATEYPAVMLEVKS